MANGDARISASGERPIRGDLALVRPKLLDEIIEDKRNCC